MCNPIKAIKKVFKRVVKAARIIVPLVLAAAAIYFTAGAALGVTGTAGGWLSSNLGLSGTLGGIVSGAVNQAGYGALLGGGISAVTGGNVGKGLLTGAVAGAVTGGITGAIQAPVSAASSGATGATGPGTPATSATPSGTVAQATSAPSNLVPSQGPTGVPVTSSQTTGLLSGAGKFITDNQTLIGGAIQGLGTGLGGLAEADAHVEAARIAADDRAAERARIAGNFDVSRSGLLTGTLSDTTRRPTPEQQFDPTTVIARAQGRRWQYNPATGRVELI